MRTLIVVAIAALLAGPAYAQGLPPIGIPMGGDKPEKPVDPAKEKEYRSAIGGISAPKAADPWGSVRESKSPPPAPAKKTPPAGGNNAAASAKKNSATAKTTDAPKKAN